VSEARNPLLVFAILFNRGVQRVLEFAISRLAWIVRKIETWWNLKRTVLGRAELQSGRCQGIDVMSFGGLTRMNELGPGPTQEFSDAVQGTYEPPFLATFKNVTLVGSEPILVTSDGRTILESALNEASFLRSAGYDRIGYPGSLSELFRNLSRRQVFGKPIFPLIRLWSRGYYHWHAESLVSLYSYHHYVDATALRPKLLVHEDRPGWMRSSLALMGIPDDDVVEWTATYGRADTVVLASLNRAFMAPDPDALRWVSAQMRRHLIEPCSIRLNPNIYISRANALTRKVLNEEEVVCALEKLGFSYYALETLAYGDQVRLFSQASFVVGAHGSGFVNALHSEGAILFELFEPSWVKSYYCNLACALGLGYEFMMCNGRETNIVVDVTKLMRRVEAALEMQNSARSGGASGN
jgi:Glycosyltransferase 61